MRLSTAVRRLELESLLMGFFRDNHDVKVGQEFKARDLKGYCKSNGQALLSLQETGVIDCVRIDVESVEIPDESKMYGSRTPRHILRYIDTKQEVRNMRELEVGRPVEKVINPEYATKIVQSKLKVYRLRANTVEDIINVVNGVFDSKIHRAIDKPSKQHNSYWHSLRNYIE